MRTMLKKYGGVIILGSMVLIQLLVLFYFNLVRMEGQADFDSSSGMVQLVQIWEQKTYLIENWDYQTTAGWDIPMFFAVPIYGLTGNVFFSMGFVNCLFVSLMVFGIMDILRHCSVTFKHICIVLILFLTPYTLGQLSYVPMLFTGAASYCVKLLVVLLLLDLCVRLECGRSWKSNGVLLTLFLGLTLLTVVSSGIYVVVCGILPVLLYIVMKCLWKNDLKYMISPVAKVVYMSLGITILGILLSKVFHLTNSSSSMTLLPLEEVGQNAVACFVSVFELFGGFLPGQGYAIMSLKGILCLVSILVVVFIIGVILYYGIRVLRKKEKRSLVLYVLSLLFVNVGIFLVTDTSYSDSMFECRYHIIPMVVAMLLVGVFLKDMRKRCNTLCRYTFVTAFVVGALGVSIVNFLEYGTQVKNRELYIESVDTIAKELKKHDAKVVSFFAKDDSDLYDARILRVCDFDLDVNILNSYQNGLGWGASTKYFESGAYEGPIAVVADEDALNDIPAPVKAQMKKVGEAKDYQVFIADKNLYDCNASMSENRKVEIDYPHTPGYEVPKGMNEVGEAVAPEEGGRVMASPGVLPVAGTYDLEVMYHSPLSSGKVGTMQVHASDGEILGTVELMAGETKAVISDFKVDEAKEMIFYEVQAEPQSGLLVKQLRTERKSK